MQDTKKVFLFSVWLQHFKFPDLLPILIKLQTQQSCWVEVGEEETSYAHVQVPQDLISEVEGGGGKQALTRHS